MKHGVKQHAMLAIGMTLLLVICVANQANAYQVTLSLYNQGFDINAFYNNGDFDVEAGFVEADPSSLLVIVGDPANVEEILEIPDIPDPFALDEAGSDFHFEIAQPFRFQDRFDGLFSTTVDDPVLFVPDNGTVTAFRDDGLLADDRIDLGDYEAELPPMYVEVDYGDTITMTTYDGTKLFITRVWRNPDFTVTFDISDVPESGTVVLLALGLVGILGIVRRKRMKRTFKMAVMLLLVSLICTVFSSSAHAIEIGEGASGDVRQAFIDAYQSVLGNPIDRVQDNGIGGLYQKFEDGSIEYSDIGTYAVWGTIYKKWGELGYAKGSAGVPTRAEMPAATSPPHTTTGKVQFFEKADIYLHKSGAYDGQAFEVRGYIRNEYNGIEGSGGDLGFPISDEYTDPYTEYARSDFEGGCIVSNDGTKWYPIIGCKAGEPPCPCCVKKGETLLSACQDSTIVVNEDYVSKIEVEFPNAETIEDVLKAIESIGKYASVTGVNPCVPDEPGLNMPKFSEERSTLCCPTNTPCTKEKIKREGSGEFDAGGVTCDFPFAGVPYIASLNATINGSVGFSFGLNGETTCDSGKFCGFFEPKIEVGGGLSGILLHRSIARPAITVQARRNIGGSELCYTVGQGFCAKFSSTLSFYIVGDIELFSCVTPSVESKIGEKDLGTLKFGKCY